MKEREESERRLHDHRLETWRKHVSGGNMAASRVTPGPGVNLSCTAFGFII